MSLARFAIVMESVAMDLKKASTVTGIWVGTLVEKIAMYAILFLNDPGLSLKGALQI